MKKEEIDKISKLYLDGGSTKEISKLFGRSQSCIITNLRNNNIKLRGSKKYYMKSNFFQKIDSNEKAYILGFFYGDGCIRKTTKYWNFSLCLKIDDAYIMNDMCRIMNYNYNLLYSDKTDRRDGRNYTNATLYIYDQNICKDLLKLGLHPNKSFDLEFPDFLEEKFKWPFIRGLFDSDGCIDKYGYEISIIGTIEICNGIKDVFDNYDITSKVIITNKYAKPLARIKVYNKNNLLKIFKLMYRNSKIHLKRKYDRFLMLKNKPNFKSLKMRGELNPNCKINIKIAKQIKYFLQHGYKVPEIVRKFGVSTHIVRDIKRNKTWKYV